MVEYSVSTPMMRQYLDIKKKHPDKLVLFRLGDFYEFFFDDAKVAASELNLVLTSRHNDIPMCGIPHHAADSYINRLVKKGYKLAVCDQMEDPKLAKTIVRREVTQIITPGTVTNTLMLEDRRNNYLFSLNILDKEVSAAFCDISTGDLFVSFSDSSSKEDFFENIMCRFPPAEILINPLLAEPSVKKVLSVFVPEGSINEYEKWTFDFEIASEYICRHYNIKTLKPFGLDEKPVMAGAVASLLSYVEETQKQSLATIKPPRIWNGLEVMNLDRTTIRNLELVRNNQNGETEGSLLSVMDLTCTSGGGRLLFRRLLQPLLFRDRINERLNRVNFFFEDNIIRGQIRDLLKKIADLERICTRIALKKALPKETLTLRRSLETSIEIMNILKDSNLYRVFDPVPVISLIAERLSDDPSNDFETGGIIRDGFNETLDKYRASRTEGRKWIMDLEDAERKRTGISSLKIRYNNVFGYYIEITKANLSSVPADYIRKQTLANAERFTCAKLQEYESVILEAEEKTVSLERELYEKLLTDLNQYVSLIQDIYYEISKIDVESALAELAKEKNYCMPEITNDTSLIIREGRHPVVEAILSSESFVPNDLLMQDETEERIFIITGPNMAGKSTYLRQNALIVLMAQMGSFVPASFAKIGLVDRIFTRVGASDNLVRGESTFLVEMQETANILRNATNRSFIIMDEIGRGTSTYDGLSLAWAIVEYIAENIKSRTLFATHYHEITVLERIKGVKNFNILVRESEDDIIFIRRIAPGATDQSYGIQVAKLAGVPEDVIVRAKQILLDLEADNVRDVIVEQKKRGKDKISDEQLFLFQSIESQVAGEIKRIDENSITPVEALNLISSWKKLLKGK